MARSENVLQPTKRLLTDALWHHAIRCEARTIFHFVKLPFQWTLGEPTYLSSKETIILARFFRIKIVSGGQKFSRTFYAVSLVGAAKSTLRGCDNLRLAMTLRVTQPGSTWTWTSINKKLQDFQNLSKKVVIIFCCGRLGLVVDCRLLLSFIFNQVKLVMFLLLFHIYSSNLIAQKIEIVKSDWSCTYLVNDFSIIRTRQVVWLVKSMKSRSKKFVSWKF